MTRLVWTTGPALRPANGSQPRSPQTAQAAGCKARPRLQGLGPWHVQTRLLPMVSVPFKKLGVQGGAIPPLGPSPDWHPFA